MTDTPRHVIFGTGAIGLATLDALRRRGETARLVNRSGSARVPEIGEVWHLPNDPDTRTTRQLVDIVYRQAGRPAGKVRAMPPVLLRALGLVDATMRELVEMQYQFEEPFIVDSSKIANKLGAEATPLPQALADTLRDYRRG
jgi:nucleoside-diphosphate-sugar epimerase